MHRAESGGLKAANEKLHGKMGHTASALRFHGNPNRPR